MLAADASLLLLRTLHLAFVISWIGRLYWVNLAESPFEEENNTRRRGSDVVLWWKWSPLGAVATGAAVLLLRERQSGTEAFFRSAYSVFILTGAMLGLLMALNVWLVIRPEKRRLKELVTGQRAAAQSTAVVQGLRRIGFVTRTNTLFSMPTLFFMSAAPHYLRWARVVDQRRLWLWLGLSLLIIALVEINGLMGPDGPGRRALESVRGVVALGLVFGGILFAVSRIALGGWG
jgi:uncharacterized membrane protein